MIVPLLEPGFDVAKLTEKELLDSLEMVAFAAGATGRKYDNLDELAPIAGDLKDEALSRIPSGWISVKDRLPAERQKCIVRRRSDLVGHYVETAMYVPDDEPPGFVYQYQPWRDTDEITHWRPLPDPPNESAS